MEDPPEPTTVLDAIFVLIVVIIVPLFCFVLGVWVAFARPFDPNAWFILLLLRLTRKHSIPEHFDGGFRPGWRFDFIGTSQLVS